MKPAASIAIGFCHVFSFLGWKNYISSTQETKDLIVKAGIKKC